MNTSNQYLLKLILSVLMLVFLLSSTYFMIHHARKLQRYKTDEAELRHVRHGLFSTETWRMQITNILTARIDELKLSETDREQIRSILEKMLHRLIDEIDQNMREKNLETIGGLFKQIFTDIFIDLRSMKDDVPNYAELILDELESNDKKEKIQALLLKEMDKLIDGSDALESKARVAAILESHNCPDTGACSIYLQEKTEFHSNKSNQWAIWAAGIALAIFVVNFVKNPILRNEQIIILIISCFALLVCGITTPMIDLEAVITHLKFSLLGSELSFSNQVLFFQSKSISDIVLLMMRESDILLFVTGVLIMMFSVVFPVLKLSGSLLYVYSNYTVRKHSVLNFFVFRSGKWSMADVMVVAIFMAYIGFDSIVKTQLTHLQASNPSLQVLSFNGTKLLSGFYMFLLFTLSGLVLSEKLSRHFKNEQTIINESFPKKENL